MADIPNLVPSVKREPPPGPRVVLITGAATGIGLGIAHRLAKAGLHVAINDLHTRVGILDEAKQAIEKEAGWEVKVQCVLADVSVAEEVERMVRSVVDEFGRLDVMVANAGIIHYEPVIEANMNDWDRVWSVNVRGVALCYQHAARVMVQQGWGGRIIGASSVCGKQGFDSMGAYCASKFAVRGLTQSVSLELAQHGITVNAYAPGLIETDQSRLPHMGAPGVGVRKMMKIPYAPYGKVSDVVGLVAFLVSSEASFITGQTLSVDGGLRLD